MKSAGRVCAVRTHASLSLIKKVFWNNFPTFRRPIQPKNHAISNGTARCIMSLTNCLPCAPTARATIPSFAQHFAPQAWPTVDYRAPFGWWTWICSACSKPAWSVSDFKLAYLAVISSGRLKICFQTAWMAHVQSIGPAVLCLAVPDGLSPTKYRRCRPLHS